MDNVQEAFEIQTKYLGLNELNQWKVHLCLTASHIKGNAFSSRASFNL